MFGKAARPEQVFVLHFSDVPHPGAGIVAALADVKRLRAGGQPGHPSSERVVWPVVGGEYRQRVPVSGGVRTCPPVPHLQLRDGANVESVAARVGVCGAAGVSKSQRIVYEIGAQGLEFGKVLNYRRAHRSYIEGVSRRRPGAEIKELVSAAVQTDFNFSWRRSIRPGYGQDSRAQGIPRIFVFDVLPCVGYRYAIHCAILSSDGLSGRLPGNVGNAM